MRVIWDGGALGGYEGFCCFALGLCGFCVDVWAWRMGWLVCLVLESVCGVCLACWELFVGW